MKRTLLWFLLVSLCVTPFSWGGQGWGKNSDFTVTTMTQNMFPGADLDPIIAAGSNFDPQAAAEAIATQVIASNIPGRAALVAAEIAENQPDLVALQEVTKWKFKSGRGMIVLDQLDQLMEALKNAGQHYRVAAVQELTDIQIKGLISYTDHDAILVRTDKPLNVVGSETHIYDYLLSFELMGEEIPVLRGWMAVDVKLHGSRFKFVNTHLESPLPTDLDPEGQTKLLQEAQASQLVNDLSATDLPIILAGDFNSDAEPTHLYLSDVTDSYGLLVAYGYYDFWHVINPADPGYTWSLIGVEDGHVVFMDPFERIDLILSKGPDAVSMKTIGTDYAGFPASDHAGVVAVFQLTEPR
jgi:endonuclease/exonuclease/phosphatase family metal-dependent hydrolase